MKDFCTKLLTVPMVLLPMSNKAYCKHSSRLWVISSFGIINCKKKKERWIFFLFSPKIGLDISCILSAHPSVQVVRSLGLGFRSGWRQGGIQLTTAQHFVAQSFIITIPLSQYNSNNVDRDVKHQIVIKLSAMKTIHMKWHALFSGEKKIRKMVQKTILLTQIYLHILCDSGEGADKICRQAVLYHCLL